MVFFNNTNFGNITEKKKFTLPSIVTTSVRFNYLIFLKYIELIFLAEDHDYEYEKIFAQHKLW